MDKQKRTWIEENFKDEDFVNFAQKHELDYIRRKLKEEHPHLTDDAINEGLEHCKDNVAEPYFREDVMASLRKFLGLPEKIAPPPPLPPPKPDFKKKWKKRLKKLWVPALILMGIFFLSMLYVLFDNIFSKESPKTSPTSIMEKSGAYRDVMRYKVIIRGIQDMEAALQTKREAIGSLLKIYNDTPGTPDLDINASKLDQKAIHILEAQMENEKTKHLAHGLKEILNQSRDCRRLESRIRESEALLPKPHIVKKGESHYRIAMDFLRHRVGLKKGEASMLVGATPLNHPIFPGLKVWNFFIENEFTSLVNRDRETLLSEKIAIMLVRRDKLARDIKAFKKRLAGQQEQITALNEERKVREGREVREVREVSEPNVVNESSVEYEPGVVNEPVVGREPVVVNKPGVVREEKNDPFNLFSYKIYTEAHLVKQIFLNEGGPDAFFGNPNVPGEKSPTVINLNYRATIYIDAKELGLERISSIRLYMFPPASEGCPEYRIIYGDDRTYARFEIKKKSCFKNKRAAILVE